MRMTLLLLCFPLFLLAQNNKFPKTIHLYVALCDNVNQGIVPVPEALGNGKDPKHNLYWGALYGVKTFFRHSSDWTLIKVLPTGDEHILERVLFKHNDSNTFMLADAYDGAYIKQTTIDFLEATAGNSEICIKDDGMSLNFGGASNLMGYVGHDGLMEFNVSGRFSPQNTERRDAIILACISKDYFTPYVQKTGAYPLLWTTGLMAPEAYTLHAAIEGWIVEESNDAIRERAAIAYRNYQKCSIQAARNLLVTGY